ncbi:MAG: type VI secretion system contractile sheath large subunit [Candidatus Thiodiazotropha sp. (ex Epidulcina cf. delphinae)]|nr:type VI secretion system contractile sheath large subunit [Candidatus Thiodiazotropha sp. (ex Epidulcina cf. delphinae)]
MSERLKFSVKLGRHSRRRSSEGSGPLSCVILGEFSGAGVHPAIHKVDIDTLDTLVGRLQPKLAIPWDGADQSLSLRFDAMDDFHPDRLLSRMEGLLPLTADDESSAIPQDDAGQQAGQMEQTSAQAESAQQTLARLLGKQPLQVEQRQHRAAAVADTKQSLIRSAVRRLAQGSLPPDEASESAMGMAHQAHPIQSATLLRRLLRNASFQALEAHWRSVDWLLRSTEADEDIRFHLLDTTRHALETALAASGDPADSSLFRLIQQQVTTDHASSETDIMLIADFSFAPRRQDIALLDGLGRIAASLGGSLIAAAERVFLQHHATDESSADAWHAFRETPAASRISLLLPRILLRLPYGTDTDPIDAFSFEELDSNWEIKHLLWGNPAYAQAILRIRQRLNEHGSGDTVISDLPAYSFERDGERYLQPCTEVLLEERQARLLLDLGLIPVLGSGNMNCIQLPWHQTLAPIGSHSFE